ncbi:MAG: helix-turn-helix transcriptional regulator [Chlorobi bacterium]|nr:helix-turn-helix transcriptional regulator [Chlorobiota bacterium]
MIELTQETVITEDQEKLAKYAKALSHPVRVYILELLESKKNVYSGDLAEELPIARSTLSQHIKELKDAGLIWGNSEHPKIRYQLNPKNWDDAKRIFTRFFW